VGLFGPASDFVFAAHRAFAIAFEVAVSLISNLKFQISVAVAVALAFAFPPQRRPLELKKPNHIPLAERLFPQVFKTAQKSMHAVI
jgi:hypothetical protein